MYKQRYLTPEDSGKVKELMQAVYGHMLGIWTEELFQEQARRFPNGHVCLEHDDGYLIGAALSMVVNAADWAGDHTYRTVTDNLTLSTHTPSGDTLYGVDIMVHPKFRGLKLGRVLYNARKDIVRRLGLKSMLVTGRIPNYQEVQDTMSVHDYVDEVIKGKRYDPVLTFQMANNFTLKRIIPDYLPVDTESAGYGILLEWLPDTAS